MAILSYKAVDPCGGTGDAGRICRTVLIQLGIAAAYLLLGRVVHLYFTNTLASVLWPPSGLALAALLLGGHVTPGGYSLVHC